MTNLAILPRPGAPGTVEWLKACIDLSRAGKFSEFAPLTPAIAIELLRDNPENRSIRSTKVQQFAADMRAGNWEENGQPLILSPEGLLNDGQHRCIAVIEANTSVPVQFTFGVPRDTRLTLDQGSARSAGDFLAMEGVPHSMIQAGTARLLMGFERSNRTSFNPSSHVTSAEIRERVSTDTGIARSAAFASKHSKHAKKHVAPSVIAFCHYVFCELDPVLAEHYMVQVCRGEGLAARDPAYTVRERLLNLGTKSRDQRTHLMIRGWNALRQGRKLTLAKIAGNENIPAIV